MRAENGNILLSPSDLTAYLACEHLTTLDLQVAHGDFVTAEPTEQAQLLFEKGLAHEAAYLERLRDEGVDVREVTTDDGYETAAQATHAAIRDGVDVVYQGVLTDGRWRGVADFLVRTDDGTYEALDTKLARSAKPAYILQLCFYSELLGRLQGREPDRMHVLLGSGERQSSRPQDFDAYARDPQACRADVHVLHRLPPGFLGSRMVARPLADARMIGRLGRLRDLLCPMPQKTMTARPRRPPAFMARGAPAARSGGYSAATRSAMRPSEAISRRSSSQSVRSRTVRTVTWWIWMSRSVGLSSQPRTTAIAPPSRIAAKAARPSNAVSKRPSTPPGTTSRTARTNPSPRGMTASAPKLRTSASSSGLASAITRSPPALASAIT